MFIIDKVNVSIITVTYNSEKTLKKTIESVLNQTYPVYEYSIIDGLSTDNTVKVAESYRNSFEKKNIKFNIISQKDNGMYDAINKGIDISTGEVIGNVNSDDWYEVDTVEKVANEYKKSHFDMLYGDLRINKPTGTMIKKAKLKKFVSTRYWNHPTTFITNETYNKYKYKVESMHDDLDLMLKIRKNKLKVVVINEILSNFNFGGMSNEKNIKRTMNSIKTRCKIYKNNGYSPIYYIDTFLIELAKYILA
ncbi:glycosyltransferase family 2 protein [Clostridium sp. Ade.TY]|uniref:glycosyltransferase family 2 protein n=1 Tax=Clostridium sp. Ade.TY TaxID=1391647 RepID=UPI000688DA09|nr:glycosyltransferase family 2 protein [Clostridium sp. Ade.TY]